MSVSRLLLVFALLGLMFVEVQKLVAQQDANRDELYARTDTAALVQDLARRTGDFKEEFNRAVEHSLLDGTKLEDRAKHTADNLHDSAKKLKDVFEDKRDKNHPAVREQADRTMATGSELSRIITAHRFTEKVQHDWDLIRSDLDALARVYNLPPL
ncbi:MAG: hypothetical protein C5B51_19740 [Terriglobia bacterium]|nr:MAG: hypothetical protein C5B51_19740 [Terriglobia bacterium]